jgi:hypothetical protein
MQSELDRVHAAEQAAVARAAAAENPAPPQPSDAPAGSIPRPNNMLNVTMEDLQQQLGFDTAQWNALRVCFFYQCLKSLAYLSQDLRAQHPIHCMS